MRLRIKPVHAVIAAVNAAAVIAVAALTAAGSSMAASQRYNTAAKVWQGSSKMGYTQISCFFDNEYELTTDSVRGVEADIRSALKTVAVDDPEDGSRLIAAGYSAPLGRYTVSGDLSGRSDAEIMAVGGDFFLFRQFKLLSGAYFKDSDVMQDGAVIDRTLAFSMYGSDNVAGMKMYIFDKQFYIAGVIDDPSTDPEQRCAGSYPHAYISYEAAGQLYGGTDEYGGGGFRAITCYECIVPDPVDGFAYKTVKEHFTGSTAVIVNNTTRFDPKKRAKAYKHLSDLAVRSTAQTFPYWENASRIVEFRLSQMYHARRMILIVPALTLLWLAVIAVKVLRKQRDRLFAFISLRFEHIRWKMIKRTEARREKRIQKKANDNKPAVENDGQNKI